jgi:inner membrane transporter RhtA
MLLCSALILQLGAALATTTFGEVSPTGAAGLSFAVAAVVMLAWRPPRPRRWKPDRWRDVFGFGATTAVGASCLYLALDRLPLGSAVTIDFLGPFAVAVASAPGATVVVAATIALAGTALVAGATPSGDLVGVALALAAAVTWGLYIVIGRRAGRHGSTVESLTVAMCVAAVLTLPFSIDGIAALGSAKPLVAIALVGVFGRAIPFNLELAALHRVSPWAAGILFSFEPAIAAAVGAVFLGQRIVPLQLLGVVAVVSAGVMVLREVPVGGS